MISLAALWLPILLSAVLVFIASSIIHMALQWHRGDHARLPGEDEILAAFRKASVPPGDYVFPFAESGEEMRSDEMKAKWERGPVGRVTVWPAGPPNMGRNLALWFLYSVVVAVFAAYVASRTLAPGTAYLSVFRIVGTVAFVGFALADWQASIWWGRSWSITLKNTVDGLIYGLLTAGAFGWLWPS